jgi:hypothetical protein
MRNAIHTALLLAATVAFTACGDDKDPVSPDTSDDAVDITWAQDASNKRSSIGQTFFYNCSPNGTFDSVWGTDVYTDDSSICTAGVHAGKITRVAGGVVTIEIRAAQNTYVGSARNGVTTSNYGSWGGSFIVK